MSTTPSQYRPDVREVLESAGGYWLVPIACGWAGYALGGGTSLLPRYAVLEVLAGSVMFLVAIFIRTILYDQDDHLDTRADGPSHWMRLLLYSFLGLSFLATTLLPTIASKVEDNNPELSLFAWRIGIIGVAVHVDVLLTLLRWPSDKNIRSFRYRSFFPALLLCSCAFLEGWSLATRTIHAVALGLVIYVLLRLTSYIANVRGLVLLATLFYLAAIGVAAYPHATMPSADVFSHVTVSTLLLAFLLTCVMGIAESWRVTARVREGRESSFAMAYPPGTAVDLHIAGTNAASAFFLPTFLLVILHPAFDASALAIVPLLLGAQYVLWLVARDRWGAAGWQRLGVGFGAMWPVVLVAASWLTSPPSLTAWFAALEPPSLAGWITTAALLFNNTAPVVAQIARRRRDPNIFQMFMDTSVCLRVTTFVSTVLLLLCWASYRLGTSVMPLTPWDSAVKVKLLAYVFLAIVLILMIWVWYVKQESNTGQNASRSSAQEAPPTLSRVVLGVITCIRPFPAATAGIVAIIPLLNRLPLEQVLAVFVGFFSVTALAFILNDIVDKEKDRHQQRWKPIADGTVSVAIASVVALVFLCVTLTVLATGFSVASATVIGLALLVTVGYSRVSLKYPYAKSIVAAVLATTPLLYGYSRAGIEPSAVALSALFLFVLGRELVLDANDVEADKASHFTTVAVRFGRSRAASLGAGIVCMASLLLTSGLDGIHDYSIATVAALTFGIGAWKVAKRQGAGVTLTRVAMVAGLVALSLL